MNRSLLGMLLVLGSCTPPGARPPGWYALPDEQANRSWGSLSFGWTSSTRLEGELSLVGEAPRGKVYLAVRWANAAAPVVLTAPFASTFAVEVTPPAEARQGSPGCTGERAEGLLLAYLNEGEAADPSRDELVSVSVKPRELFSSLQVLYSQPFAWYSCAGARPAVPLLLQHDPRLRLALCAPDCGAPPFDRTHVVSAQVDLEPQGTSLSFEVLGRELEVAVEVNGLVLAAGERGQWKEGVNTVRVTAGTLAPWTAEVVLPSERLGPRLREGQLKRGEPFNLSWQAPWASSAWVNVWPLDVEALKVADPWFSAQGESLTDVFPGFFDARGCPREVPRASIQVRARLADGPFGLSVAESLVVPVAP